LQRLSKILALATVFSTKKYAIVFTNRTDFNLNSILAVVDNCATATVLNNKSLFVGELILTSAYSLVTVGGCDHRPTHYGPAVLTMRNDDDTVVKIPIPKALYFPTSLVNVISIGELSWYYGDGNFDEETYIKSTGNKLWFSWDKGRQHRMILHPPSGLPEITINEQDVERRESSFFVRAGKFVGKMCSSPLDAIFYTSTDESMATDPPDLIDEADDHHMLQLDELPGIKVGDKVRYVRDGVNKPGILLNLMCDPSRTQLLYTICCAGNEVIQTTKEFVKLEADEEVSAIPTTIDDYVH